jgi:hypothetical protein
MVRFGERIIFIGRGKRHTDEENGESKSHNELTFAATREGVYEKDVDSDPGYDVHGSSSNQISRTKRYPVTPHPIPSKKKKQHSLTGGIDEGALDSLVTTVDSVSRKYRSACTWLLCFFSSHFSDIRVCVDRSPMQ